MAQRTTRQNNFDGFGRRLRDIFGSRDTASTSAPEDTPWITVKTTSFVRESIRDFILVTTVLVTMTAFIAELLIRLELTAAWDSVQFNDLLAALSVIAIVVIGFAGYRTSRATAKQAHTITLLSEVTSNDGLFESLLNVGRMEQKDVAAIIKSDSGKYGHDDTKPGDSESAKPSDGDSPKPGDGDDTKPGDGDIQPADDDSAKSGDADDVIRVLGFYEFIASACNSQDVDTNVILKLRGEPMAASCAKLEDYIDHVREESGDGTYRAFTNLVRRYNTRKRAWEEAHDTPSPD